MWTMRNKAILEDHLMDFMDQRHGPLMGHEFAHAQRVLIALKYLIRRHPRCHVSRKAG